MIEAAIHPHAMPAPERLLKLRDVMARVGISHNTVYRWMRDGRFPRPAQLGEACVRWSEQELAAWVAAHGAQPLDVRRSPRLPARLSIRLPDHVHASLLFAAEERRTSLDAMVRSLLTTIADDDMFDAVLDDAKGGGHAAR